MSSNAPILRSLLVRIAVLCVAMATVSIAGEFAKAQPLTLTSGPYVVVADESVGDYRLIVHQSPERVIVGTLTYAVQVHTKDDDEPVEDAIVKVYGTPSEHGNRQVAPALNSPVDREYYVGRLEIEETGVWAIDVVVTHPELGEETLVLATEVFDRARGGSNLVWGTLLWLLVSLGFLGVVFYLIRKSRGVRLKLEQSTD